jgi:glycosyltransferase involved in cell wall biosynthesis
MGDHSLTPLMFSLVIPTHNRAPILKRMLAHLLALDGIRECEIIVIDDGSTDATGAVLEHFAALQPHLLRVLTVPNGGPAKARNAGVAAARFDRILFVDDDVFPRPGMLQRHAEMLDEGYTGSQGLLLWHQEIATTRLIRYIDSRGSQFAFDDVKDPTHLSFAHVYTGNFAVLRSAVLDAGGFDENLFDHELRFSAFEDTILAFHLEKNGARLGLNQLAIADHLHNMTEEQYLRREFNVGSGIGRLQLKYPDITHALGLETKGSLARCQTTLLHLINASFLGKRILSYSLSMRLRHREAAYRGYLNYRRRNQEGTFV